MNKIKKLRMAAGLTQNEVASRMNYGSAQFVSNWERGTSMFPKSAINKLAKMYKVDPIILAEIHLNKHITDLKESYKNYYKGSIWLSLKKY